MRRGAGSILSLALAAVVLLGVSAGGPAPGPPRAAEPGDAPPLADTPAGAVVEIGTEVEGLVADPVTHLVAVGTRNPTSLVLVDGRSGNVVRRVELPDRLRHLQLAGPGGPVLVPAESSGELVTVSLPDGEVGSRVPIGVYAHDATGTRSGLVAVADEMGEALALVREDQVVHRFTGLQQPGGVAAAGDLVGMIDVRGYTLTVYDTVRFTRIGWVLAGDGPTHIVADRRGRFVVADTRGDHLRIFSADPVEQVEEIPLAGSPYGITYDPERDRLWVTLTARNQVVGFDLGDGTPREVARIPTVRQPNTVAVDPDTGRLFVASRTEGTLQLVDP